MNRKNGQRLWDLLKRSAAVLLLVLFTGMPVFELVHSHEHEGQVTGHFGQQINKSAAKCKVCDHFAHYQHMPFIAAASSSVLYFEAQSLCFISAPAEKLITFCGLSWSNKGPPLG